MIMSGSAKRIPFIEPLFLKLFEIVREDCQIDELLICTILAIGRILHVHPQNDITA